jgi:hypothetical protein
VQIQFFKDVLPMRLNGMNAQAQAARNPFVAVAFGDPL